VKWAYKAVFVTLLACSAMLAAQAQRCPLPIPSFLDEVHAASAEDAARDSRNAGATGADRRVVLADVIVQSASPIPRTLRREIRSIMRQVYLSAADHNSAMTLNEAAERVRYALQQHGYYKAMVGDPQLSSRRSAGKIVASITLPIEMGPRYRFAGVTFEHGTVFPADQLSAQVPLKSGEIFNVDRVRVGLDNLRKLYGEKGYINFAPVPDTQIDEQARTIRLVIDLDEGKQFRIGKIKVIGENERAVRDFAVNHGVQSGDIYNSAVVMQFARQLVKAHLVPSGFRPDQDVEVSTAKSDDTVNIYINGATCPTQTAPASDGS
jgi:outer membrane protein assembly factor BamA